jgi:DNA-directed RNA polymerase specialized sigma24 family protein
MNQDPDTDIGGQAANFPTTRKSVVRGIASTDPKTRQDALGAVIDAYWKPVYKYVRIRWKASNEDAKDLTQEFFARVIEKGYFERYQPDRARFRTFLRACLDGFLSNQNTSAKRLKRGGGAEAISLDFEGAEAELARAGQMDAADMDGFFHREWLRSLFELAVKDLRATYQASGKQTQYLVFERYDLKGPEQGERPTYDALGREFKLPATQVTNFLAATRRDFRRLVLERLRQLCATDEEFRAEAEAILGVKPS